MSWEQPSGDAAEEVNLVRGDRVERPESQFTTLQPHGIVLPVPNRLFSLFGLILSKNSGILQEGSS